MSACLILGIMWLIGAIVAIQWMEVLRETNIQASRKRELQRLRDELRCALQPPPPTSPRRAPLPLLAPLRRTALFDPPCLPEPTFQSAPRFRPLFQTPLPHHTTSSVQWTTSLSKFRCTNVLAEHQCISCCASTLVRLNLLKDMGNGGSRQCESESYSYASLLLPSHTFVIDTR
jgi:hypothetical protein